MGDPEAVQRLLQHSPESYGQGTKRAVLVTNSLYILPLALM
jgi:hypothetical protein